MLFYWQDCIRRFECNNYPTHCGGCIDAMERDLEEEAEVCCDCRKPTPHGPRCYDCQFMHDTKGAA
jgi:hypothetical protein